MEECSNPYILVLPQREFGSVASQRHFADLIAGVSVRELLDRLGADCFEIRFEEHP